MVVKVGGKPKNRKRTKIDRKFINLDEIYGEYAICIIGLGGYTMDAPARGDAPIHVLETIYLQRVAEQEKCI